jgi:hypothetical protein
MLTNEQETIENVDPVSEKISKLFLVLSVVGMCFAEFAVIHSLWFGRNQTADGLDRFCLPFMVFFPIVGSVLMRISMTNMSKAGQIGAKAAATLKLNLGMVTTITYFGILQLAKFGPR